MLNKEKDGDGSRGKGEEKLAALEKAWRAALANKPEREDSD